jgi:hypothetical protein
MIPSGAVRVKGASLPVVQTALAPLKAPKVLSALSAKTGWYRGVFSFVLFEDGAVFFVPER